MIIAWLLFWPIGSFSSMLGLCLFCQCSTRDRAARTRGTHWGKYLTRMLASYVFCSNSGLLCVYFIAYKVYDMLCLHFVQTYSNYDLGCYSQGMLLSGSLISPDCLNQIYSWDAAISSLISPDCLNQIFSWDAAIMISPDCLNQIFSWDAAIMISPDCLNQSSVIAPSAKAYTSWWTSTVLR